MVENVVPKPKINITVDADVLDWADILSSSVGMSRSEFINLVLKSSKDTRTKLFNAIVEKWFEQEQVKLVHEKDQLKTMFEDVHTKIASTGS